MRKRIHIKKSVVVVLSLIIGLLISLFVTMLLFKITDFGITIASFGATIFMALSRDNLKKKKIYVIPSEMIELNLNLEDANINPDCKSITIDVIPRPEVLIEED